MAFKGDAAQIPLSNILQALLLNAQQGVLNIESANSLHRLRVLPNGIRLLNTANNRPDVLRAVLLKSRIVTETQFANVFSSWTPGTTYPGEFLILRRILTPELASTTVLHQIENILLELIITPDIKYEFVIDLDPTPYEIFDPETTGKDFIFNANALLMEALRREDELQRIRQHIPSASEIFVSAGKPGSFGKLSEQFQIPLAEIKPFLTGEYSVEQITHLTSLCSFEVYSVLNALLKNSSIRVLTVEEKKSLADRFRKCLRLDDSRQVLQNILASDPTDSESRGKLIAVLEKTKATADELAPHYLYLADQFSTEDPQKAEAFLKKAVDVFPLNVAANERLLDLYHGRDNKAAFLAVARSLVSAVNAGADCVSVIELLTRATTYYPDEPLLFESLAEAHIQAKDHPSAISCLTTAADLYSQQGAVDKHASLSVALSRLTSRSLPTPKRGRQRPENTIRPSSRLIRLVSLYGFVGLLSLLVLFVVTLELSSRSAYAQVTDSVSRHCDSGNLVAARTALERFLRDYPYSTRVTLANSRLAELKRVIRQQQEAKVATERREAELADVNYGKAKVAFDLQDYIRAYDLLKSINLNVAHSERRAQVAQLLGQLESYFQQAKALLARADAAEQAGNFEESHSLKRELLSRFPYSYSARDLVFPVKIDSRPPRADVFVDGTLVGQTPLVLRLSVGHHQSVSLTRRGFKGVDLTKSGRGQPGLNVLKMSSVSVSLEKEAHWVFNGRGSIEGFPAVDRENVYFGTRSGVIYCLKQGTGEMVWQFTIPGSMDFSGGLYCWERVLYFGSYDGRLYALDAASGKPVLQPFQATPESLPIKIAPSRPSASGVVVFNCERRKLVGFSLASRQPTWSFAATGGDLLGEPLSADGRIYIALSNGDLNVLEQDTGRLLKKLSVGSEIHSRGDVFGAMYCVTTPQSTLHSINLGSGVKTLVHGFEEQLSCPPVSHETGVLAVATTGRLYSLSFGGEVLWSCALGDSVAPDAFPLIHGSKILVGTERGRIHCLDRQTGVVDWIFQSGSQSNRSPRRVLSRGVAVGSYFFIGLEDGNFFCFYIE